MILLVLVALETDTVASSSTIVQSTVITTLVLLSRAHAQGVKQSSVVVGTKIARSRVLDVCARYKHPQSVDIGEKLVCTRFEFFKTAYECNKSCIFCSACLWFIDHTHSFSIITSMRMRLRMLKHGVGKGRHVMKQLRVCLRVLQYYAIVATERAGYVLYRALVCFANRSPNLIHKLCIELFRHQY